MKSEIKIVVNEQAGKNLLIEYGDLAKQASGSGIVKMGETIVLATIVYAKKEKEGTDFLPLTVDYRERTYAAGKIPGGFFKREGRPSEREILTSRLIDRALRPLFPEKWYKETNINVLVLSSDGENDPDVIAIVAAGIALRLSSVPVNSQVAAVRVGRIGDSFILNPTFSEQKQSSIDIVVGGTMEGVVMVEAGTNEVSEGEALQAIGFGHDAIKRIISGFEKIPVGSKIAVSELANVDAEKIREKISLILPLEDLRNIVKTPEKSARENLWEEKKLYIVNLIATEFTNVTVPLEKIADGILEDMFYECVREVVLKEGLRADGRKPDDIRPIRCIPHYFDRPHGSAIFERGQTQALATVTLGTPEDKQIMDVLEGEYKERFLFHYNFPGFATGEAKPERGVSRREQGHGALAKRAIYPVLPSEDEFPYTIRIVSDILESNGSSSMASVCAGSLAIFDAGVPAKNAVAGVAMGLVKGSDKYVILTDIMGMEDHIGDMDFKVAGTRKGITALQMDLKITNINLSTMKDALEKARAARFYILDIMDRAINSPREKISEYAPQMDIIQINPSKIGALIGPGGKNIKKIIEETKADIQVEDDGKVYISAVESSSMELARQMVDYYTAEAEVGKIYRGKVTSIKAFGAFVEILPGKEGLVHISQFVPRRLEKVTDVVREGDEINVKVIEIDPHGKVSLTCKSIENKFKE